MSAAFTRTDAWRKTPETPEEAAAMLAACREDTRRGIPADPAIDPCPDPCWWTSSTGGLRSSRASCPWGRRR